MPELQDLKDIRKQASEEIASINPCDIVSVPKEVLEKIVSVYHDEFDQEQMGSVGGHTLWFQNSGGQSHFISVQEFPLLVALTNLVRALEAYGAGLEEIAAAMGFESRTGDGGDLFGKLPSNHIDSALSESELVSLEEAIDSTIASEDQRARMRKFLGDPEWSGLADAQGNVGRKLNRSTDWQESAVLKTGKMIAAANAGRIRLIRALVKAGIVKGDVQVQAASSTLQTEVKVVGRIEGGDNTLFYGAPGTGKSYSVWQSINKNEDSYFVTVFHPDMQNSDFAGTLKPGSNEDGDVTYAFRPGPFARAVAAAWAKPEKKVYLVIEELNRAVAAAVFGELFQLLDREPDGSSSYEVEFPSPEFANWFAEETGMTRDRLSLPSNLWILATMNSADQGVYPLDTAFRRRWRQNYLAIDYQIAPETVFDLAAADGTLAADWRSFVEVLNGFLVRELQVDEDRLIGPRFVDEHDLEDGQLPGKLLIYLWDDLLRHHADKALFHPSVKTYGDLDRRMSAGKQIFSDGFLEAFAEPATDESAETLKA